MQTAVGTCHWNMLHIIPGLTVYVIVDYMVLSSIGLPFRARAKNIRRLPKSGASPVLHVGGLSLIFLRPFLPLALVPFL